MSRAHGRECYAKLRARLERHRVHVESLFPMNLNCFATGNRRMTQCLLIASAKTQSKPLLYPSRQPDPNLV